MDGMEPFKRGHLLTPPQGKILKRTWQRKYYALYQASNLGIERVEIFDSEEQYLHHSANKLIPLSDCVKVVQAPQKHQPNVFEVICKNQLYQYSAETTQQLAEWIAAFQTVAFGPQRRESYPPPTSVPCRQSNPIPDEIQQEENMLYSSMTGPELYVVTAKDTDASRRCGLRGSYQLIITPVHIALASGGKGAGARNVIFTWPYKFIRRFQRDRETFTFEAGRKSESGEGFFVFNTTQGNAIFQRVSEYLKTYKKQDGNACLTKHTTMTPECRTQNESNTTKDNNKGKAKPPPAFALPPIPNESLYENTMPGQARPPITKPPRKKLPSVSSQGKENREQVSPSHITPEPAAKVDKNNLDKNNVSIALKSPRSQEADEDDYNELEMNVADDGLVETAPLQPVQNSELLYDEPEQRKDAWKTFGLEKEVLHTENTPHNTEESGPMYASVDVTTIASPPPSSSSSPGSFRARNKSLPDSKTVKPVLAGRQFSVIAPRTQNSDNSYDRLFQFNLPTNRGNPHPDHIYKKLGPAQSPGCEVTSLQDDYSTVHDGYKVPLRTEDDSYTDPIDSIPKTEAMPIIKDAEVPHFVTNDDVYSIVTKPNKAS